VWLLSLYLFGTILLQDNGWVPEVQTIQQQYFRQTGSVDATPVFGPSSFTCVRQQNGQEVDLDLGVELSIAQAPASFALPLAPHHPFNLPFRTSLRFAATSAAILNVCVRASVLTAEDLLNIEYWMPLPTTDPRLMGAQVHAELTLADCGRSLEDGSRVYTCTHDFLFLGLQFTQTTNNEPIFLAFHADLPAPSPHIYTVFLLPTVVCNPGNAAEHAHAAQLLWKGTIPPPPVERPRWTFQDFCTHVTHQLQVAIELNRSLGPLDQLALAHRAGFYLKNRVGSDGNVDLNGSSMNTASVDNSGWDGPCVDGGPTTEEEVESLQVYIHKTQAFLKLMREYYERMDPQVLCGFSIGRREAVSLLEAQPPGTFLLRFSYEAGCLAVSHVVYTGQVFHSKITMQQLQRVSLEELLSLAGNLDYLLDPNTGLRYPREQVLDRGYITEPRIEQIVRAQKYNNHSNQYNNHPQQYIPHTIAGEGGGYGINLNKTALSDGASTNPSAGSALAEVHHQASEGEQLPEQGLLHNPLAGGGSGSGGGNGAPQ
jgi:SH2 domain